VKSILFYWKTQRTADLPPGALSGGLVEWLCGFFNKIDQNINNLIPCFLFYQDTIIGTGVLKTCLQAP